MNKPRLLLFLSPQLPTYNCSFKQLSELPLCVFGLESASLAAHKGFILSLRDKRSHDTGKKLSHAELEAYIPRRAQVGGGSQWCPEPPTSWGDSGPGWGKTVPQLSQPPHEPGLSQADFGLRICEQVLFSSGNWWGFNSGRGEALKSWTTTGWGVSWNALAEKDLCGTGVWELT